MNDVTRERSTRRRLRNGVHEVVVIELGILLSFSAVAAELSRMLTSASEAALARFHPRSLSR
jgi:hypothetical protein